LDLFVLGKEIIIQRLAGFLVLQADALIIGKEFIPHSLGLYRMGQKLVNLLPTAFVYQIQQVVFTDLAQSPNNKEYVNRRYYQFVFITGLILVLYILCFYYLVPIVVPIILGPQWDALIPVSKVFSVSIVTAYICSLNNEVSKILGFARIYTYYTTVRSIITIIGILIAANYSLKHVIITWVGIGMISNVINEVIFYSYQKVVRLSPIKVFLYLSVWCWAIFTISQYTSN